MSPPRPERGRIGQTHRRRKRGGAGNDVAEEEEEEEKEKAEEKETERPPDSSPRRTLLARAEAEVLIRIGQLAVEQDVLGGMLAEAIGPAELCAELRSGIERSVGQQRQSSPAGPEADAEAARPLHHPPPMRGAHHLMALLPLLSVHGMGRLRRTARHVSSESGRILRELDALSIELRRHAEQNWSMAEHLEYMAGERAGREKGALAEVEEAVCDRIEGMVALARAGADGGREEEEQPQPQPPQQPVEEEEEEGQPPRSKRRRTGKDDGSGSAAAAAADDGSLPPPTFDPSGLVPLAELCGRLFGDGHGACGDEEAAAASPPSPAAGSGPPETEPSASMDQSSTSSSSSSETEGEELDEVDHGGGGGGGGGSSEGRSSEGTSSGSPRTPHDAVIIEVGGGEKETEERGGNLSGSSDCERGVGTQNAATALQYLAATK